MATYWIVGVSGGPDSMALLDQLRVEKRSLVVVHVNYHQRDSAQRDQDLVERYCQQYQIPCVVFDGSNLGEGNFQDLARRFRYQAFREVYVAYDAGRLVLGHHLDDQYETILFELLSQRKPDYLGMRKYSRIQKMLVYRPLLETSKEELIDYCHQHNIEYGIDESNLDRTYTRNQIRQVLKDFSQEDKQLLLAYRRHYGRIRKQQNKEVQKFLTTQSSRMNLQAYQLLEDRIRPLVLRAFFKDHQIDTHEMSFRFFKDLDDKIKRGSHFDQMIDENLMLRLEYGYIFMVGTTRASYEYVLEKVQYFETKYFKVQATGPSNCALTLYESDFPITIRSPKPEDEIYMRFGHKKVSRFFIDRKIGKQERQLWPVVENARKEVIFVTNLGCDINHYSTKPSLYVVK